MNVRLKGPQPLRGEVRAPGSKAYTHRALIAALLTEEESTIIGGLQSDDTQRTLRAIQQLGARVNAHKNSLTVQGKRNPPAPKEPITCGESGATLRFLTAVAATSSKSTTLTASRGLASRPLGPLVQAITSLGAKIQTHTTQEGLEVQVKGPLIGGEVSVPGNISSQFISGLLFAASLSAGDVVINVQGELESRPYVDMTVDVLRRHGIEIEESEKRFIVRAPQLFKPASHEVPGDYSSAAFLIAALGTAGDQITLSGLGSYDCGPDVAIMKIASNIGLEIEKDGDNFIIGRKELKGFEFDARNNPDLVPPLEALACFADGTSEIRGVKRLVYKESDRLHSLPAELVKMGSALQIEEDRVIIHGGMKMIGGVLDSHGDHRVAMACAAASLGATGESIIQHSEVVSKSYPDFFQDLARLGAPVHVE